MIIMTSPRFSPPSSEAGDCATSPALSSSSRTTTSVPTDLSDVSSLDGEEFEVIDAPFLPRDDAVEEEQESDDLEDRYDGSIRSEIDESTFIAPAHSFGHDRDHDWDKTNDKLRASTSLATLQDAEGIELSSLASSRLRFPDPLDQSFQSEVHSSMPCSSEDVSIHERPRPFSLSQARMAQAGPSQLQDYNQPMKGKDEEHGEQQDGLELKGSGKLWKPEQAGKDESTPVPPPAGMPFRWDKRLIVGAALQTIMGLIVIILSTGVLPVWPDSPAVPTRMQVQNCETTPLSWMESLRGQAAPCSSPVASTTKALMVKPESRASVFNTMTSFMARPSGKAVHYANHSKQVSVAKAECNAVSLYIGQARASNSVSVLLGTAPTSLQKIKLTQHGDGLSRAAWTSTLERSKVATQNAKVITTSLRKEWHVWAQELNQLYRTMALPVVQAVSQQAVMRVRGTRDGFKATQEHAFSVLAFLQRAWTDWMVDVHKLLWSIALRMQEESSRVKRDWDQAYDQVELAFGKHLKLVRGGAQRVWKGASQVMASKQRVTRAVQDVRRLAMAKRASLHAAASEEAVKRRWEEVQLLRLRHRQMVKMVREQEHKNGRAARWLKTAKVAFYRKAIQSVQARHRVEDMLHRVAQDHGGGAGKAKKAKTRVEKRRGKKRGKMGKGQGKYQRRRTSLGL